MQGDGVEHPAVVLLGAMNPHKTCAGLPVVVGGLVVLVVLMVALARGRGRNRQTKKTSNARPKPGILPGPVVSWSDIWMSKRER